MLRWFLLQIKRWIHTVDVSGIQFLTQKFNCLTKTLEVYHFTFPEEFDNIIDIRIVTQPKDIVIGCASLLLWERIA